MIRTFIPAALLAQGGWPSPDLPWYRLPAAVSALHPVHDQPWLRWQRAMADAMAGPTASPLFRDTASSLDVTWRLLEAGQRALDLTADDAAQARDLSITGATLGLGRMLRDTVDRSETLHAVREIGRAAISPGFEIDRHGKETRLALGTEPDAPAAARAAIDLPRPQRGRPAALPLVRVGTGLGLVDAQTGAATGLAEKPVPAVQAWVDLGSPGRATVRADARWSAPWDANQTALPGWELSGRLPVGDGFALNLSAVGASQTGLPLRERLGLSHPVPGMPAWILRLAGTHLDSAGPSDPEEWRVDLVLRANLDWNIPVDIDRWPLGQQVGAPGPVWPSLPDASPNAVAPVVRTPTARAQAPLPSPSGPTQRF